MRPWLAYNVTFLHYRATSIEGLSTIRVGWRSVSCQNNLVVHFTQRGPPTEMDAGSSRDTDEDKVVMVSLPKYIGKAGTS